MPATARRALTLAALAALAVALVWAITGLPDFGEYPGPYGIVLEHIVVDQRHVTELVGAVVFDYRGLDTLGEEFILLTAVIGCTVLLRSRRAERDGEDEEEGDEEQEPPTLAVRSIGAVLVGPLLLVGMYIVAHGHISPGGGFQGGVLLAAALLAVYSAEQTLRLRGVREESALEVTEAVGALGFAAIGLGGLIGAGALLWNFLPLGSAGMLLSGGTIPVGNLVVGLEVTGAFALLFSEFLDQALLAPGEE
jgi:multicomponent Na+:H+ antiporter subunit B